MKKNTKGIIIALIVFLVLVAAFLIFYFVSRPKTVEGQKAITVEVIQLDGTSKDYPIKTTAEYLADALIENNLISGTNSEFGLMVTAVAGIQADDSLEQWWMLTVDGEFSEYGVSDLPVIDGGHYEWTLTEGWDW